MDCGLLDERFLAGVSNSPLLHRLSHDTLAVLRDPAQYRAAVYLDTLSRLSLDPAFTANVFIHYEPIFLELVARWRKFGTAEQVFCAFARVLPVAPHLVEVADHFLLPKTGTSTPYTTEYWAAKDVETVKEVLLAMLRLLRFQRETFLSLVDAAGFYALLKSAERVIRLLVVRILAIQLGIAEGAREEMAKRYGVGRDSERVTGLWEDTEVDYGFLLLLESQRLKKLTEEVAAARTTPTTTSNRSRIIQSTDWSPMIVDMSGVLMPRLLETRPNRTSVVDTPTTRENIHTLALALRDTTPLLVTGHTGAGKTTMIHQIADSLGALETMVSVHLGDQTDAKLLIGTYSTAADCPGSFEWRPGVLTTAVREGRWVLVEDIDKAPTDVLGVLLPLIERGELLHASRGERIKAARGFRLIATVRTSSSQKQDTASTVNLLGNRLWNRVDVKMPGLDELEQIVNGRFPLLHTMASAIIAVYTSIQSLYREPAFLAISKSTISRHMSPRDVFKWCTRMDVLFRDAGVKVNSTTLPESLYDKIFREAVDCFAGNLHTPDARRLVAARIAEQLHIPSQRLDHFLTGETPGFKDTERSVAVGRAKLKKRKDPTALKRRKKSLTPAKRPFAQTSHALKLMEQVGVAIRLSEPVLLVGETGTGKTTIVQHLADLIGFNLTAINLSQQTESGDLLGGYKPVDVRSLAVPLKETFDPLFANTFSAKKNERFIDAFQKCWGKQQWTKVIKLWLSAADLAEKELAKPEKQEPVDDNGQPKKKRKLDRVEKAALQAQWIQFAQGVRTLERQSSQLSKSFAFSFVEGALVKAARNGDWVLLDEINLASPDTLESIADLLKDGGNGSIILSEKGDVERVKAHPDFRIFACMNPATDVGKRDLPPSIRSRFTELYVTNPDADFENLLAIITEYIGHLTIGDERAVSDVAKLYMEAKQLAEAHLLVDGASQRPHFSIRTLTRTLSYVVEISGVYGLRRSLYEGFCMSFLTLLDSSSEKILLPIIDKYILGQQKNVRGFMNQIPQRPTDGEQYVPFKHYWMRRGTLEPQDQAHYIITPFVERNMLNLVRATATRKFPVLVQGPTSSGKTSMIEYLAKRTGNKFVRINNHEHTDLQEYMGTYVSDNDGQLSFREGILVEALRKGHWIVLDELNLAPTDVLEALNRLLDDNRELLIPETQEVVRPHKNFMLFATQNPPGLYGGRKNLSRAFRNRFLELHFDDIPEDELETILKERCQIAPSYCTRIVKVYKELSLLRQSSRLFEQKNSFATLRDLFRWANREAVGYQELAENGYMLLAERVRKDEEKQAVKEVLEKVMRVKIDESALYTYDRIPEYVEYLSNAQNGEVVWTSAMTRLFSLVANALRNQEPVLLVGETGCGKTTVCQMLADAVHKKLTIVNAHMNTETGDIIGAQRPKRNRSGHQAELVEDLKAVLKQVSNSVDHDFDEMDLDGLLKAYAALDDAQAASIPEDRKNAIEVNKTRIKGLFEWADGPLIQSMKQGAFFLLDEISLADDSVLERLNSVLEPERTILLAEKGPIESQIKASNGFQFLATMNPGGDYGKKELSPALRNRFTEIWVPAMTRFEDMLQIVRSKLKPGLDYLAEPIVKYSQWFSQEFNFTETAIVSIRDILAWIRFINLYEQDPKLGALHGAALVYFDSLGANPSAVLTMSEDVGQQKMKCVEKLSELLQYDLKPLYAEGVQVQATDEAVQVGPFAVSRVSIPTKPLSFNLTAPTTALNAMRVIRAMQLRRPILLEGSPGVGKTSLITALAQATGNPLTRINLSEQTDLMDLFGSDVPVEGGQSGEFAWRDAPFLRAMQKGHWVLLDEMNLASQSVLEGLNACLDHRGVAYIAELDREFKCHPDFVVFAAQNPHHQGGGRKGLPASFVNRFTVVYVESLSLEDLRMIAEKLYPSVQQDMVEKLIRFVIELDKELTLRRSFGAIGGPWEFNLRDTLRWLELLTANDVLPGNKTPEEFIDIVIKQRFRTSEDRKRVDQLFTAVFGELPKKRHLWHHLADHSFQVGHAVLPRAGDLQHVSVDGLAVLKQQLPVLETVMTCIQKNMPCILVGASGSGKSSVLRLLASVVGAEVDQMALNNDVDTTDIVGGFEQVDMSRKIFTLLNTLEQIIRRQVIKITQSGNQPKDAMLGLLDVCRATQVQSDIERLTLLRDCLQDLTNEEMGSLDALTEQAEQLLEEAHQAKAARFEWVDGVLVKAVEQGHWLILDNANLCSPSVLDRLNSLLEVGGYLAVNEHSNADGDPKIIVPHPNFRFFITMDPRHGELSRAMRNRCVEIYMDSIAVADLPEEAINDDAELQRAGDFADATATDHAVFARLDKAVEKLHVVGSEDMVWATLEHVPRPSAAMVNRLKGGMDADAPSARILEAFMGLIEHPKVMAVATEFLSSTRNGLQLPNDFDNAQSLVPLRNPYLSVTLPLANVAAYHNFYTAARSVQEIAAIENSILQKSTTRKLAQMTFIEKSASQMSKSKRSSKSKSSASPLFEFLSSIRRVLQSWLKEVNGVEGAENVLEMTEIWKDMVRVCDATKLDESVLQVYLWLAEEWKKSAKGKLEASVMEKAEKALAVLATPLKLTTGLEMERMWTKMRPSVPRNLKAWEQWEKLREVMERFDGIAGEADLNSALTTKKALLSASEALLLENADVDGLVQEIFTSIEKVEATRITGLKEYSRRAFLPAFDLLLKLRTLRETHLNDDVIRLAHYSGRPTTNLLGYASMDNRARVAFQQVLEDLWVYPTEKEKDRGVQRLLDGKIIKEMLSVGDTAKKTVIGQLRHIGPELGELAKQFVGSTEKIVKDHVEAIMEDLWDKVKQVLSILDPSEEKVLLKACTSLEQSGFSSPDAAGAIASAIRRAQPPQLHGIIDEHLTPVLHSFHRFSSSENFHDRTLVAGSAWIHYALACMKLYVPDNAMDPALKPMILKSRYNTRLTELRTAIEAERQHELMFTGQTTNNKMEVLQTRLEALGQEPADSLIARPEQSQMSQLHGELMGLLQVVAGEPHKRILPMIEQRQQGYAEQVNLVQMNLSQVAERLKSVNSVYKDIVDPVLGFLYSLKLGFELAAAGVRDSDAGVDAQAFADPLEELPASTNHGNEAQLFCLRKLAARSSTEGLVKLDPSARDSITTIFKRLYQKWKTETEEARENAQNDSSLYTYRGETADFDAKEFQAMFPDYEEDEDGDGTGGDEEKKGVPKTSEHGALAANIAECHAALFAGQHTLDLGLESIIKSGVSLWRKAAGEHQQSRLTTDEMEKFLPSVLLSLMSTTEWARGTLNSRSYDFYVDGNIAEANKLVTVIHKTLNRVARLCETWPENVTLQDAVEVCQQILEFPNDTPVAKFITKVEKLHGILHEWQSVASKEFSTAEHFDAITQLIISWRKLELTTWPRLFDREDERARQTALAWWFFLFESVIANPLALLKDGQNLSDHAKQLLDSLASFMATSSVGQYQHRLQLVKAFEHHVQFIVTDTPKMEVVLRAIKNFAYYYEQYIGPIEEQLKQGRKKSEKEVADVVLLASWKDTGILALRESAKRSHHKLYKVIRKYRQALDNSAAPLLATMPSLDKFPGKSPFAVSEVAYNKESVTDAYSKLVKLWERRPQRLQDLEAVGRMMLRASKVDDTKIDLTDFMEEFSTGIITTIKSLQAETPGILSDDNKDMIKHLKTRKRKLLADTLAELRNMGFTSNPSRAVLRKQAAMEDILVNAKSIDTAENIVQTEGVQQYFVRLVEALMKARTASKEHSQDLERNEVARCSGYLEHMVSLVVEQRASVAITLRDFMALQEARDKYRILANMGVEDPALFGHEVLQLSNVGCATKIMCWLPKMLEFTTKLLKIHREFTGDELTAIEKTVSDWITTAKELDLKLTKERYIHADLWTASSKKVVDTVLAFLRQLQTELVIIGEQTPKVSYTLGPILRWISKPGSWDVTELTNGTVTENTILTLDSTIEKLADSILVALQRLKSTNASLPTETDTAGWFIALQTTTASSISALHMKNVTRKIIDAIDFAASVRPLDATTSQAIRAVFASYNPIIERYVNISHDILQRTISSHRATAKAAYILCTNATTLFQKGFCQPAEAGDAGGEKTGDLESGTGLGEGEGVEDISKDIGADEDMSELAQQQDPEDKDKKDIEDEEDAVNMDHEDMEGQMGDKEGKDDEGEGEEGEDEEKDMDEEVGDVDDLDPDAVDEKMWDAEQDEDLKEKDGGDAKGKKQPGDELEAKKEEKKEGGEQGENDPEAPEESEGMDMGDEVKQQDQAEGMDDHVPEVETLDLPEDLQLDGDESGEEKDEDGEGEEDFDMDDLSDVEKEDENMKDVETIQEDEEKFPDLDHAPNPEGPPEEEKEGEEGAEEEEDKGDEQGDGVQDDEPPEGDEPMEEPDRLLTTKDDDTSKEAEETAASEEQAVQGGMDTSESNEQASAQQQSGEEVKADNEKQGKGTENAASSEEQNAGDASKQEQDQSQQQKAEHEEDARKESEFRKVGDILEKWHRQRREILNAKEDDEDRPLAESMELDDPEFEHLPNEDAAADTQALGAATEEQATTLDEQMAIDSGVKEAMDAMEDTEPEKPDADAIPEPIEHDKSEPVEGGEVDEPRGAGAVIGETKQLPSESRKEDEPDLMDLDMEVPDDFGSSEMDISTNDPSTTISVRSRDEARQLWQQHESSTRTLSASLCEHLRLILAPTQATKMRGDFRTGKRLNMRRILPYIASDYKKDKIWLRRAKPSKRQYHVILAVDDSKSMAEGSCSDLALETVALVARALSSLEVGSIAVVSFGEAIDVVHPFEKPFTSDSGVRAFERFSFSQTKTDVRRMVEKSLTLFESARNAAVGTQAELWQLEIVISDGVCEDHDTVRRLVRKAMEQRVMLVFVIVDSVRKDSILKLDSVKFGPDGQIKMERYLDTFPFGYYLVVKDVRELPTVLAGALRQWFAESVDVGGV